MASIALPPSRRTARPASDARWWGATTMPRVARGVSIIELYPCHAITLPARGNDGVGPVPPSTVETAYLTAPGAIFSTTATRRARARDRSFWARELQRAF